MTDQSIIEDANSKRAELHQLDDFGDFVVSRGHLDRIKDYEPRVDHLKELMHSLKLLCDDYAARQSSQSEPVAHDELQEEIASEHLDDVIAWLSERGLYDPIDYEHEGPDFAAILTMHEQELTKPLAAPQQATPAELQECVWLFKDKTWTTIEAMGKDNFGIKAYLSPISLSSKIQDMIKDGGYGEMANVALNDVISMLKPHQPHL
jgi:hypothetical protein